MNLLPYLRLTPAATTRYQLFAYILFAYAAGVAIRLLMLTKYAEAEAFWQSDGTPVPVLTPDAGQYAYHAAQILKGDFYSVFQPDILPAYLLAAIGYLIPVHFDWLILLSPLFIAPLVVVPVILIGKHYNQPLLGLFAALFTVVDVNFYSRSGIGYFDTDILNLFFPLLAVLSMIRVSDSGRLTSAILGVASLWGFGLWYHSAAPINFALLLNFLLVSLLFYRRNSVNFQAFFLYAAAIAPLPPYLTPILALSLYGFFCFLNKKTVLPSRYYIGIIVSIFVIAALTLNTTRYYQRALAYFDSPTMKHISTPTGDYHYINQLRTVAEAQPINPFMPDGTYSQQTVVAGLSALGILLFALAYPSMFNIFALLILGLAAYFFGNRFLMYGTPALTLGLSFFMFLLFDLWRRFSDAERPFGPMRNVTLLLLLSFAISYVVDFNTRRGFILNLDASDAEGLRRLAAQLSPKDHIINWWDFGWPMWYYADTSNTFTDNGLHGGIDSYAVSRIFISDSSAFVQNAACYLSLASEEAKKQHFPFTLQYLAQQEELQALFDAFGDQNRSFPCSEGGIYLFTHGLMTPIIRDIRLGSNFNIRTAMAGEINKLAYDEFLEPFDMNSTIAQGQHYTFYTRKGVVEDNGRTFPVRSVTVSKDHRVAGQKFYDNNSTLHLIISRGVLAFYFDDTYFNSFYVQTYFLDNYDRTRFEKVIETDHMKIFKVLPAPAH